jgi:hypothetical protein
MRTLRLGYLGVLAVACALAFAVGAPVASAAEVECEAIKGSGSSLQNLAQIEVWGPTFEATGFTHENAEKGNGEAPFERCKATTKITYVATSSGKGLGSWGSKTAALTPAEAGNGESLDEFVGTDVGPEGTATTKQIGNMNTAGKTAVLTVPVAQSAITIMVSLPVGCNLTAATAKAWINNMQLQEEWNTNAINFANLVDNVGVEKIAACEVDPSLQARETSSGTTAGFKRYLDDLNHAVYGACTATAEEAESASCWPNLANKNEAGNSTGGKLAEEVFKTPGTVGYADLADARKAGFTGVVPTAKHKNGAGEEYYSFIVELNDDGNVASGTHWSSPEAANEAANCAVEKHEATYPEPAEVKPNVDWSVAKQGNWEAGKEVPAKVVYPLCTLTFDVAWESYSAVAWKNAKTGVAEKYTNKETNTVFNYLSWVVNETGGQSLGALSTKHFAPLPAKTRKEAEKGIKAANLKF